MEDTDTTNLAQFRGFYKENSILVLKKVETHINPDDINVQVRSIGLLLCFVFIVVCFSFLVKMN